MQFSHYEEVPEYRSREIIAKRYGHQFSPGYLKFMIRKERWKRNGESKI